ncbi:MAG TPA: asparagine synthase (glutamine-hydrolyzing) [Candidatus Anoxymicrobiaceae bacterium]
MCGILGYVTRGAIDMAAFDRALSLLACRGPDASRTTTRTIGDATVVLGHTRLAVIDPGPEGNQPMERGSSVVVYNGEIYNFRDLASELGRENVTLRTRSDTEVLLAGYERWGERLVDRLDGMFAFALLDEGRGRVFCARDHFGKKPFFYFLDGERFVFASELKALVAFPEVRASLDIDKRSLAKFLVYGYVPSPHTIFDKASKLEPATSMAFDIASWSIADKERFWKLEDVAGDRRIGDEEALEGVEDLLIRSVRKRLVADVPLGVFLSGGVDSSLIAAMVARESHDVESFTVTYKDFADDEGAYASRVASELGIRQHCTDFHEGDARENFLEITDYLDEPIADAALVPLFFIAKTSRPLITVALGGDGGDEVFGGYSKYRAQLLAERLGKAAPLLSRLKGLAPGADSYRLLEGMGLPFHERQFLYGSGGFTPNEAARIMRLEGGAQWLFEDAAAAAARFAQTDHLNESLYLDCMLQLPDWYLVKADRATMAASLELRSPLLDRELAEFAFSLPGSMKVREGETKFLLKKLASKYVPPDVVYRRKQGFAVPLGRWIDTVLREDFERVLGMDFGLFDPSIPRSLFDDPAGRLAYGREFKLLRIFVVNNYLDRIGWGKGS